MITPVQIHAMLHRHAGDYPRRFVSIEHLWNWATLAWLAAQLLRRYADQNPGATVPSQRAQLDHALHTVEREMQWLRFCGADAQEIDLVRAVSSALSCAEQATTLLESHVSDELSEPWLREGSLATWNGVAL